MAVAPGFKPNIHCRVILEAVRDHELLEEWEVGNYVVAGFVRDTGDLCDPYELTEDGEEALRR